VAAAFERRAARAGSLAAGSDGAAETLRFAAGLYRVQARLATAVAALHSEQPLSGRLETDLDRLLAGLRDLLDLVAGEGPPLLAEEARRRAHEPRSRAGSRLATWWTDGGGGAEDYLGRAFLRPYVEMLAGLGVPPDRGTRPGRCPFCGAAPAIAARRTESDSDGARRVLGCALCGGEWSFNRVCCPRCSEQDPARLPSFSSETHPIVRIEACETCRCYVKSIDLTRDGRAIPEVDDLLSLSMDLWATSAHFERIEPGLAGPLSVR
jgi:FdhE protein